MSDNTRSIIFTLILCFVCSLLLTTASTAFKPVQEKNIILNRQQNILKAAGYISEGTKISSAETESIFSKKIKTASYDYKGQNLLFYLTHDENNNINGYIVPLESKGLWGKIYGYIAIKKDGKTISGVSIYQHQETPGLGGEIEKQPFLKNFKDKSILDESDIFRGIMVAKGKAANSVSKEERKHYVDGISGATLTGKYLSQGLLSTLNKYDPISLQFRSGHYQFKSQ